jgi:hypothetical protein
MFPSLFLRYSFGYAYLTPLKIKGNSEGIAKKTRRNPVSAISELPL